MLNEGPLPSDSRTWRSVETESFCVEKLCEGRPKTWSKSWEKDKRGGRARVIHSRRGPQPQFSIIKVCLSRLQWLPRSTNVLA